MSLMSIPFKHKMKNSTYNLDKNNMRYIYLQMILTNEIRKM